MSSLLKSTKKRSISAKRKDAVALITKIEPKNAAYGFDQPTGENLAFKMTLYILTRERDWI